MVLPDHKVAITNQSGQTLLSFIIQKLLPRKEIRAPVKRLILSLEKH